MSNKLGVSLLARIMFIMIVVSVTITVHTCIQIQLYFQVIIENYKVIKKQ